MMEFLVRIEVVWPPDGDPSQRDQIMAAEATRRSELIDQGLLLRLWRDPGHWANWTLWQVADTSELHEALLSLPFHPWLDITVHPLARHEADPGGH